MSKLLFALTLLFSTNTIAAPQWGDESVTEDFLAAGDVIYKIIDNLTVESRWKNSLKFIKRYNPNPLNIDACQDAMVRISSIFVFANRIAVIGDDGCNELKAHLIDKRRMRLVSEIQIFAHGPIFCGARATVTSFALCVDTGYGEQYSNGIRVFSTLTGRPVYSSPVTHLGDIFEHEIKTLDFTLVRGVLVWAFGYSTSPGAGYTRSQIVAYNMATDRAIWRRDFADEGLGVKTQAGLVRHGTPGIETYYSSATGAAIPW